MKQKTSPKRIDSIRENRNTQSRIFDIYAEHELGDQLFKPLDYHPEILPWIEQYMRTGETVSTGPKGLSVESVFRCLLLKQILQHSYEKLAFHLCDSPTYRTFARLSTRHMPSRSGLQATIRQVSPQTLEKINGLLVSRWVKEGHLSVDSLRIDSTVVLSNIQPPSDSQLLNDGILVLSRMMIKYKSQCGVNLRFTDPRKRSKSLALQIFNAKSPEKTSTLPQTPTLQRCCSSTSDADDCAPEIYLRP